MSESTQLVAAQMAYDNEKKSPTPAWLLWWFTGGLGGHRYYLGDTGYAVAMTLCGWMTLGIWPLIDAFNINRRLRQKNALKQQEVFIRYGVANMLPNEVRAELAAMPEVQNSGQGQLQGQGQQAALPQGQFQPQQGQYQPQAQQNQYQPGQFQQNQQGYVPQQQYYQNPQAQQYSQDFQQGYAQQSYQAQPQGYAEQQSQEPFVTQESAEQAPAEPVQLDQAQQASPQQTEPVQGEKLTEDEQSN